MTFKLLALDLDETLLDGNSQISGKIVQPSGRCGQRRVSYPRHRPYVCSALPYARQLEIDLPLITYHGALIRTVSGKDLFIGLLLLHRQRKLWRRL